MQTETKIGTGQIYERMNVRSFIILLVSFMVLFALAGLGHTFLPMPPHFLNSANHSQLARSLGFNLLASIYMFIAYTVALATMAVAARTAVRAEGRLLLPMLLFMLWLSSYFEFLFPGDTVLTSIVLGFVDSLPICIISWLWFRLTAKRGKEQPRYLSAVVSIVRSMPIGRFIAVVLLVIATRLLGYVMGLRSAWQSQPLATLCHAFILGLLLAISHEVYSFLEGRTSQSSIRFCCMFLLPNWFMVNLFIPLTLQEGYFDFIVFRTCTDTAAVLIASLLFARTVKRRIA